MHLSNNLLSNQDNMERNHWQNASNLKAKSRPLAFFGTVKQAEVS
jgi:hypothetical protein